MAYTTSQTYKNIIYSGNAEQKLRLWVNNVEITDIEDYCEEITINNRIFPNGSETFNINDLIAKEVQIIVHDLQPSTFNGVIKFSIGALIDESNNTYEYIPMGVFNIQEIPTTDGETTTITLRDNSIKLDVPYNAKPLLDLNDGTATLLQILNDICATCNLTTKITTFPNSNKLIGIYDNTINARIYVNYIAGQAGAIPIIDRDGELDFVYVNNLTTHKIPLNILESYELGKPYQISKVIFESGIIKYEAGTDINDIMYLDSANVYINTQEQVNSIYNIVNGFKIDSVTTGKVLGDPSIDSWDLIQVYGYYDNNDDFVADENTIVFTTFANSRYTYNGVSTTQYETIVSNEKRETNVSLTSTETYKKEVKTTIDNMKGELELSVKENEIITKLNLAIVDGQGVINATGNKFILDADNASIDEYGNAEFNNATLRGGDLILEDNGGESSSIQIHALNSQDSKVIMEQDLSNLTITIKEPKNFTISSLPAQDILLTTHGGFEIAIQPIVDDDYNYSIYTTNPSQELTKLKIESFDFDYELYHVEDYSTINVVQTNANTGSIDFINSENPFSNLIRIVGTESIDKISKYSSSGIDLDIYNSYATNNGYIPTQEEIDEVAIRITQGDTFTQEEIEKYDCNNDGIITPADLLALKKIMLTGATMTQPAHFSINTETSNQALGVEEIMSLKDGNGNIRVALGMNGIYFKGNNLIGIEKIWDGNTETTTSGLYMSDSQTINLSKKISDCLKGITLVWYGYDPINMTRVNTVVSKQFISKEDIANNINHHVTTMAFIKYTHVGTKLVIVYDDRINGHISNVQNGTANGITYENTYFVLGDIYAE